MESALEFQCVQEKSSRRQHGSKNQKQVRGYVSLQHEERLSTGEENNTNSWGKNNTKEGNDANTFLRSYKKDPEYVQQESKGNS